MNKPAPRFRRIASPLEDVSDDDLSKLVDRLGVPSLVKPEQPPTPVPLAQAATAGNSGNAATVNEVKQDAPALTMKAQATALERVSVDLPEYLYGAMRMRVAEERTTMRYLVMQGLQAIGFAIDPSDFVSDGRSTRTKSN
jgi:hypothetical protein